MYDSKLLTPKEVRQIAGIEQQAFAYEYAATWATNRAEREWAESNALQCWGQIARIRGDVEETVLA